MGTEHQHGLKKSVETCEEQIRSGVPVDGTMDAIRRLMSEEARAEQSFLRTNENRSHTALSGPRITSRFAAVLRRLSGRPLRSRSIEPRPASLFGHVNERTFTVTPRMMVPALFASVFLIEPWLIPGLGLFFLTVVMIVFFSLGSDRVTEIVVFRYECLRERDPDKATRLRQAAVRLSARAATWVDCLPARWTQGLYLPDFDDAAPQHEKLSQDPFDRLASDAQNI